MSTKDVCQKLATAIFSMEEATAYFNYLEEDSGSSEDTNFINVNSKLQTALEMLISTKIAVESYYLKKFN